MKLVNLFGAPGAGKSTAAAHIFSVLKGKHIKAELVGEFAKELIYAGNEVQLVNQVYICGAQYKKQKDLERYGIDVGISDSPLKLQMIYCQDKPYYKELTQLVEKLDTEFENINVFINRASPYQQYGRTHTEAESDQISKKIWAGMNGNFDYVLDGNNIGLSNFEDWLVTNIDLEILNKF